MPSPVSKIRRTMPHKVNTFILCWILVVVAAGLVAFSPVAAAHSPETGGRMSDHRTWHILIGGQSKNKAIQAEGYYPRVITIDAGDSVVWTLNTGETHSVTFAGTCQELSCIPECVFTVMIDVSPCGPAQYDGVSAIASSGRMVPPEYNWNDTVPHGNTTYSLTFTMPGVNVYFDLSVPGMRGVVIVDPVGTPYPFTQEQYSRQASEQLRADLKAGSQSRRAVQSQSVTTSSDRARVHLVSLGASVREAASSILNSATGSTVVGNALLTGLGVGSSPNPSISVRVDLSGLTPGSVHSVQILLGVCGAVAPTTGLLFSQIFVPPTFTLNTVTAGPDGTGVSTTVLTELPNANGPGQLRIPSSGWFINVAAGPVADNGSSSVACGNLVFHNASVMRYFPQTIHVMVGDTIVWTDDTINEIHGVTFLAGQKLPLVPDWFFAPPTGNATSYDGSTFVNSGPLYGADSGRNHSFVLTFTKPGRFSYVDVADASLGMRGTVIVTPQDSR
jgi:plastocyanin